MKGSVILEFLKMLSESCKPTMMGHSRVFSSLTWCQQNVGGGRTRSFFGDYLGDWLYSLGGGCISLPNFYAPHSQRFFFPLLLFSPAGAPGLFLRAHSRTPFLHFASNFVIHRRGCLRSFWLCPCSRAKVSFFTKNWYCINFLLLITL